MTWETITLSAEDGVAILTFNRPDRLNALNAKFFREVDDAIDTLTRDGARALVVTGAGRAFSSGADLQDMLAGGIPDDLGEIMDRDYNPLATRLAGLEIPVITAINGPAAGAGLSFALAGDISVMARSAYLLLAFVNIGLVPDAGATWLVAKGVGRAKAMEMALLGERMSAEEALDAGLVNRVVDDADVLPAALDIARKLASGPTVAIGLIRKQVAAALSSSLADTLMDERVNQRVAGRTRDFAEAVAAFVEKRKPVFEGR